MRKILMSLLVAAALPTVAFAAPAQHAEHNMNATPTNKGMCMSGVNHSKLVKGMELNDEQRQKLQTAHRTQMEKNYEITQRYLSKLSAAEKTAMEKELQGARDQEAKTVRDALTPEQQQRYDELSKKQAERAEFEAWKAAREAKKAN